LTKVFERGKLNEIEKILPSRQGIRKEITNMENIKIATTKYVKGYTLEFITGFNKGMHRIKDIDIPSNDIQILLKRDRDEEVILSAISHFGSFGVDEELWEVMPNRETRNDVEGYLTSKQVFNFMSKLVKEDRL